MSLVYPALFVILNFIALVITYFFMKCVYGKTDTALFIVLAMVFGIAAESIGLATGTYHYGDLYGLNFGGTAVPLAISIAWAWVLGISMLIADKLTKGSTLRYIVTAVVAVVWDFVLMEPLAMHTGLWNWTNPIIELWVAPAINYIGWFIVAIATSLTWTIFSSERALEEVENINFKMCFK